MKRMTEKEMIANPVFAMECLIELLDVNYCSMNFGLCLAMVDLLPDNARRCDIKPAMSAIGITFDDVKRLTPELTEKGHEPSFWFTDERNPAPRIEYLKKKIIEIKKLNLKK